MDEPTSNGGGDDSGEPGDSLVPAGLPSRSAYVLAFLSVVLAGAFGGIIGYGLADISAEGGGSAGPVLGALVGAVVAAGGVGIVAVLVLRAQAEWHTTAPGDEREPPGS